MKIRLTFALWGAALVLGGCSSGETKSTTMTSFRQLQAGSLSPEAGQDPSHEALVNQLRAGGAKLMPGKLEEMPISAPTDASAPAEPAETVESLKAELKAAQVELEMAKLRAELKAARDKIAELEKAAEPAPPE